MNKKILLITSLVFFTCTVALSTVLYLQFQRNIELLFVRIDKQKLKLSIIGKGGQVLKEFPVAVGTGLGDKVKKGDMKTPEGIFSVQEILDAHDWKYDFTDDSLGLIKGAYGPWFIRLNVPGQKGIGIHGTYDSSTIGKRISHGCVRMKNADVEYLKNLIRVGAPVIITAGLKDYEAELSDTTKLGKITTIK